MIENWFEINTKWFKVVLSDIRVYFIEENSTYEFFNFIALVSLKFYLNV